MGNSQDNCSRNQLTSADHQSTIVIRPDSIPQRNVSRTGESTTEGPSHSVIIPVYNDPDGVRLTLESVTGQTYPTDDYEVLAVDNGSDDGTRAVIEIYPDLVTLVENKM